MIFKSLAATAAIMAQLASPAAAQASPAITQPGSTVPLLIGTYTAGESRGIYLYNFNTKTGHIDPKPVQITPAENPSWLTLSKDHHTLYAVDENGDGQRDPVGRVSAYRLSPATGQLTFLNRTSSLGSEPTYSSLSTDGRYLFVANYAVNADPGGTLAVVPVASDGTLRPVTQIKTHRASMVDKARQMSPHVHSIVSSPDGRYVFAQDLGADRIYVYRYDPAHPENPLSALKDQPFVDLPGGSGPRHLVFSRDGKHAWLTLEMAGQVAMFDHADGHLTLRQTLPLVPSDFHGKVGAGALHLSPDGRFLSVTDRGTDNQFVTFAVAPTTGELSFVGHRSVEGQEPREFAFDPTGRFVIVANQHSHAVVVFHRDPATGLIGDMVQSLPLDQASDIKFVE